MQRIQMEPVQWSHIKHIDDIEQLNDSDYDVISELGDVLRRHGLEDKFGVCLLHKHFDMNDGDRMFEETDHENEILVSRKVSSDSYRAEDSIETMWRFSKGIDSVTVCERVCDYFLGHKNKHKKVAR